MLLLIPLFSLRQLLLTLTLILLIPSNPQLVRKALVGSGGC